MLLSDRSLLKAIGVGRIVIDPAPHHAAIQPSSVDLRLGRWVRRFPGTPSADLVVDPFDHSTYQNLTALIRIPLEGIVINPFEFLLGATIERIELDTIHAGRLEGKSSLGRLGIEIHSTAGFIDPGFQGHPTLEISNNLPYPVRLYAGMYIAQLAVFRMDQVAKNSYADMGKYNNQSEQPQESRYYKNRRP